ncbi:MAG: IS66 family insertion sequence element accessory protein TnpB [Firmicutes bacterium]|nr:IS66 family insertion sequence element accessory protein TnpB [Candidatus Alectryobacillus merdavium]
MIKFNENKNIYLYSENVDMRMGMPKIQLMVAMNFSKMEIRHSVFIFCSKDKKQIRLYYEDDYGCWLLQNRLHDGNFKRPKVLNNIKITKNQLIGLCKGLEMIESEKNRCNEYEYF